MIKIVKDIKKANCLTHSGTFHADEVFATAFLELYLKDIKLFRTTNFTKDELAKDVLIYDIGREEFDHHQENAQIRPNGITYSSFGLLWQKFGLSYLKQEQIPNFELVFSKIDESFITAIDAIDNGQFPHIESPYKVKTISDIIKLYNPSYESTEDETTQFLKAEKIAKSIFEEVISNAVGKSKAETKLLKIIKNNKNKQYLILDEFIPYEEVLLSTDTTSSILFVIFPSNRGGYAIKTVPISLTDRTPRQELPDEWAGLDNEELQKVSNIKGLTFCHRNKFIASCKDLDTAILVVNKLLNIN